MEPSAFLHHDNIRVLGDANTGALVFPAALRRPRRAPLRRGPAAPLSQSVRARRWRTSRYWTRCVWTVVTWWRTAFCDARSTGAEKKGREDMGAGERRENDPKTAVDQLAPCVRSQNKNHFAACADSVVRPPYSSRHCPLLDRRSDEHATDNQSCVSVPSTRNRQNDCF